MSIHRVSTFAFLALLLILSSNTVIVSTRSLNVGVLRVTYFRSPRQVAPSSVFSVDLDVEYAVHQNATIRAAIFRVDSQSNPFWESESANVTGGGDKVWTIKLTAPPTEETLALSAYAYYLDSGVWKYYNDTLYGPGYTQIQIKVARNANIQIELGAPGIQFAVGNWTERTSQTGRGVITLPVGTTYMVSVPSTVQFENSTRILFRTWNDGNNQTQRTILLDGDMRLVGSYRTQYLLRVASTVSNYSYTKWYDADSNVQLQAKLTLMIWPLESIGLKYDFAGWSGDVNSQSPEINFTMNSPKTINGNYSLDYGPLIIPVIVVAGSVGAAVLGLLRRRIADQAHGKPEAKPTGSELTCKNCGKDVEENWTHCISCGAKLGSSPETVEQ